MDTGPRIRYDSLMPIKTAPVERRRHARSSHHALTVSLVRPISSGPVEFVNLSPGGVCLRLRDPLEMHSEVRLQLTPASRTEKGVQCPGRVAWVMQRLDLRSSAPFVYDVGIEFPEPPALIRHLLTPDAADSTPASKTEARSKMLAPFQVKGRRFLPRLSRETRHEPWHLVISVEDVPCFSGRFASEREADAAITKFKRQQSARKA